VNAKFDFATGPFTHQLLAGVDYSNYFERTLTASGLSTPIDIYNPVSTGVTVMPYTLLPEQLNTQIGFYVQDQIRYADRVTLVVGARRDRARSLTRGVEERIDEAWTFKAGLIGELGAGFSPYLSYSEAFQPIPGFDRDGDALVPTRGRQIEGGIKWQPRRGVLVTAAYYDVVESNRPTNDPLDPINIFQTGEVTSRGVELEAAVSLPGNFELTAAYSYTDAKVTESLFAPEVGLRLSDVPQHMASAWGVKTVRVGDGATLRLGAGVRYVGDTVSTGAAGSLETPGHTLVDALAALDLGDWSFSVNATNLFDKSYFAPCRSFGDCFTGNRRYVVGALAYRF
jgi:iron complex outermembrane recepter protein